MDKVHQSGVYAALAAVSGGGGFTVISAPIFAGVLFVASAVLFGFAFKPQLAQTRLHLPFRKKRPQLAPDATADHPTAETVRKRRKQLLAAGGRSIGNVGLCGDSRLSPFGNGARP